MAVEECLRRRIMFDELEIDNNSYTTTKESGFTITFKFILKHVVEEWNVSNDSSSPIRYLGQVTDPEIVTYVKIKKDQIFHHRHASKFVGDKLNHWNFCRNHRAMVVTFALLKANRAIKSLSDDSTWNAVEIRCPVTMMHHHYLYEVTNGAGMVPAKESSIEMLRRVANLGNSEEICTVCLKEMTGECEALAMPCGHVFHEDCIKEWLGISHYCPLCRHELPTDD
ncbi:uncharacterized protein LOC127258047 [Andrographis paniculata]|uniref:uncharacterized protein LOC127258047 n=1 Tax=Andrographis paniculata TaxID=175694 RepID=UPI0021E70BF8|nr:uncharacterized protein LOC127258047 [Andrographis paniculata]